jgi:hypothetical protein
VQSPGHVSVTVVLTNTGAGHHVPTDFPGRHMILTVAARDAQGRTVDLLAGPVVPDWGGAQAGRPGTAFAKVLQDVATGEAPVVSYWRQARIVSDNRIPAMGSHRSSYAFDAPWRTGPVTVTAELRFRRTFQAEMDARGWDTPDIVMETATLVHPTQPEATLFLPLLLRGS